jgi:hypothetical protein
MSLPAADSPLARAVLLLRHRAGGLEPWTTDGAAGFAWCDGDGNEYAVELRPRPARGARCPLDLAWRRIEIGDDAAHADRPAWRFARRCRAAVAGSAGAESGEIGKE